MRVLHLLATDRRRGAELFAVELARALQGRTGPDGSTFENRLAALAADRGAAPLDVPVPGRGPLTDLVRTADVVVGHGSRTARVARRRRRPPLVYRVIGDPRHWSGRPDRRLRVAWTLRRAERIAVYDPRTAEVVVDHLGLDPDRVRVIPKGIDTAAHPRPSRERVAAARRRWGLPADAPVAVWCGSLSAEKDPLTAVDAAALLDGVHLLVVGDGPLAAAVDDRIRSRGLTRRVHRTGPLVDVGHALDAADVLVSTSLTEGTAGVLLEAALHGLALAGTAVGGTPDVVVDGHTGALFTPRDPAAAADAVTRALERRVEWATAARRRVREHHDMGRVADAWGSLLGELVTG